MRSILTLTIALVCLLCISFTEVAAQGNTTCKTTSLDWYTSTVGETPCRTYERLRQICNAAYRVGSLSPATPPDACNDQLADCCCNSVSFALSMLCLNCQQGVGTGLNGDNGIDAGVGAYQDYLGHCSPNVNQSLPNDIQAAVCSNEIKIDDDLYGLFWGSGAWFYMYTREKIQKNQQALANNTFTHCASTTINTSANSNSGTNSSSITTTTTTTTSSSRSTGTGTSSSSMGTTGTTSGTSSSTSSTSSTNNTTNGGGSSSNGTNSNGTTSSTTSGSDGTFTSSPNSTGPTRPSSLSVGAIAGVAIGAVAVLSVAAILFFFLWRRRRRNSSSEKDQIKPFVTPAGESGNNIPSQAQLLFNNNSQSPSRSGKHGQLTLLQTTNSDLPMGHSPLPSAPSSSNVTALPLSSQVSSGESSERHIDGGPLLQRSGSGRLPPAYGELWNGA